MADVLHELEKHFPVLRANIVDQKGSLRQRVNIFVNEELIHDRSI